jgi:hypothetical protein
VQIGRVLTATCYQVRDGLSNNEIFLKSCHFVPDHEQMLGEAVIKAVLEFRFGVSYFGDLLGMAVNAALDSKGIDENLARVVRENGGPCDLDMFEVVLVKNMVVATKLHLGEEEGGSVD